MLYGKMLSKKYRAKHEVQPVHMPIKDELRRSLFLSKHIEEPSVIENVPRPEGIRSETEPKIIISLTLDAEARLPVMTERKGKSRLKGSTDRLRA